MFYSVRHVTRFRYSNPVRESVMELKMQPRSESHQALRNFQIATKPRAQLYAYTDHYGNAVYHFNVLREHSELWIDAQSAIEHPLEAGRGVCQDFAHIMIAMARSWGVPARYVSGYLFHRREDKNRSGDDATHAWVEAYLPSFGWLGFDPTNNVLAGDRHIRVAVGRDYADVPPTRGTFKGDAESE